MAVISKEGRIAMEKRAVFAALSLGLAVLAGPGWAAEVQTVEPLTFYGVEMKRDAEISLKEFEKYARSHGQANYVLSRTPFVDYEGTGDVILASYETDRAAAEKLAEEIPGKGHVLEIRVQPVAVSEKRGVAVFKLPLLRTEKSTSGDIWVRAGKNEPQRIEKRVVLGSLEPNISGLFKFVGFSDRESALVYCLDECRRYDLVSGVTSPEKRISGVEAAGIHRSVDNLLAKEGQEACKGKMTGDFIQNADKSGYYRGICPVKGSQPVLEVRLKRDSGRWQVINHAWQQR
jgi:hypothetical protein